MKPKPFVPLEKQQKKLQRAEHAKRRGSWFGINPVTKKPKNPMAYDRKSFKNMGLDD